MARRNLTEGPVWKALTAMSAPMSFGILAVLSIGLADAYFLGQLGEAPLAAVGFIYPITITITSLSIGLSAGANAAISQAIGKNTDADAPNRLALHALGAGLTLALLVAAALWLLAPTVLGWMGATGQPLEEATSYMPVWALSFPFLVAMMIINAAFRAHGDGTASALIMVLAAVVNLALNPALIFGWGPFPELGTQGAAVATAVGRALAVAAALTYAIRLGILQTCAKPLKGLAGSLREIFTVGLPAAFSNAINPFGMALVTSAVATLGDAAVAGFGAATRVQSISIVALLALSAGIGPVIGQNWGADRQDRARAAVVQAWGFCLVYGIVLGTLLFSFADQIAGLFAEGDAARYAARYLQIVGWSLFGYGVLVTANAAMNARSKALFSMGLSLSRIVVVYVPLAWLGAMWLGYDGILYAAVAANLFAVLGALVTARATGLLPRRIAGHVPQVFGAA